MLNSFLAKKRFKLVLSGVSLAGVGVAFLYYPLRLRSLKSEHKCWSLSATATLFAPSYSECDLKGVEETQKLLSKLPASHLLDQLATVEFLLRWPRLATFYYETKRRLSQQVIPQQEKRSLLLEQSYFPQLFFFDLLLPQKKKNSLNNNFVSNTLNWLRAFQVESNKESSTRYPTNFFYMHMQHFFPEELILRLGRCLALLESKNALPAPEVASSDYDRWRELEPIPVVSDAALSSVEWQQLDRGILEMAKVCVYTFKNLSCAWIVDMSPLNVNLATSRQFHEQWNKAVSYLYAHFAKCFEQHHWLWIAGVSDEWLDLDILLDTTHRYNVPCRLYYKDEWINSETKTFVKDSYHSYSRSFPFQVLEAVERNAIQLLILQVPHLWLFQLRSRDIRDQRILWQCSDLDVLGAAFVQRLGGNVLWLHVPNQVLSALQSNYWRHWIFSPYHREAFQIERQLIKEQLTNLPL
ncbi:hypothetical protein GpartN1_g5151.t1 [Galdieria partita]|uniref:Uncharacterized protein n=1 Tax=Galdieria partita TaxID=83374 RepID=A0A9C7USD0_9RHOD|nr:hypothetical protein GpartN1_g2103.t1 [Galdieria partita]GJQ13360.1 hypothetical protein GpartN1_g5151.t1 [Galdieria partita]